MPFRLCVILIVPSCRLHTPLSDEASVHEDAIKAAAVLCCSAARLSAAPPLSRPLCLMRVLLPAAVTEWQVRRWQQRWRWWWRRRTHHQPAEAPPVGQVGHSFARLFTTYPLMCSVQLWMAGLHCYWPL